MSNNLEKKFLEGSNALAEVVARCKPEVVAAYPITPQTHIVEGLAEMKAQGKLDAEYLYAESEFAAASMVLGASAAGSRVYTATTSQGLLLMIEVLYNIAGMRLPVVMTVANRSVGAPLNIWNDTQDGVTVRDAGWVNLWAEDLTEAGLMHVAAFRLAESLRLPVMVNVDGFVLTHTAETVEMPTAEFAEKFAPKVEFKEKLDSVNPVSMGTYAMPKHYHLFRQDLQKAVIDSAEEIRKIFAEINAETGKMETGLVTGYKHEDAEILLVSMGSLLGTMKDAVDEMREKGVKVGTIKVRSLRPFPDTEVREVCKNAKFIAVLDKNLSVGTEGVLTTEIKRALFGRTSAKVQGFVVGLGGKDIVRNDIAQIAEKVQEAGDETTFI